ncbi:B12-binding domain-containing radical SAM protein, partial [Gemmatimonadota bacterium]
MKVLLIAPAQILNDGTLLQQPRLWLPGLTLPRIAALTPDDVEVEIITETIQEIDYETDADLVAISGMGGTVMRGWQISDEFRKRGKKVVMGGIVVTLAPEKSLDHCDSIVLGEAEGIWPQVVRDAQKGQLEPIYRAPHQDDLQDLPVPRLDLFPANKLGFWLPLEAGRGCVHDCDFCSVAQFHQGVYRKRPVEQIARDVEAII